MPSTPVLNAQGQPVKSALRADDDVTRSPPGGPAKGWCLGSRFYLLRFMTAKFSYLRVELNCISRTSCLESNLNYRD